MLLDGRAQPTGIRQRGAETTVLLVFNAWQDLVNFTLPEAPGGQGWLLVADTNMADLPEDKSFAFGHVYAVTARSMLVLVLDH